MLKVYVSGAVSAPGVYVMAQGKRVADAIQAAGGATEAALLHCVNLAAVVRDEDYYHVPEAPGNARIDLNTTSHQQLDSLPEIGPTLATAIIEYRETHGPFRSIDEIMKVPRIGPLTLERIRDLVRVIVAGP